MYNLTKLNFLSQRGIEANCWRERNKIIVTFRIVPLIARKLGNTKIILEIELVNYEK